MSAVGRRKSSKRERRPHMLKEIHMATMETITERDRITTITTHYIDGAFVESHGREVMDIIKPTNGQVIARVTQGDEEDTRRAIAAKRALATYGRTTKFSAPCCVLSLITLRTR